MATEEEAEDSLRAIARVRTEILLGALQSKENPAAVGKVLQSLFEKSVKRGSYGSVWLVANERRLRF